MIRMYGVTKIYKNGVKALDNINLHIRKGEFVFLVGPSGAGKSTLTKLVFREELPSKGQVLFNGKNVARLRGRDIPMLRRKIGMVFQDFRLLPRKTVFENVAFALEVTGVSPREIRRRVPQVLQMVGLEKKGQFLPAQLSGGEQQRVGIARAIVNDPVLIIADEPTGNLDPETSWELMELFQRINEKGTTIIMATHAWDIVDAMKKRVVALSAGRIVRDEESGGYRDEA
ncbi:cell division ATP-binding protein FtsE [Desulfofundulus thermobenzoicus]|uniref:Cell division ATP-binding protein FtsE n=1 Tax=Desulfofundulus thermobenzoicus TaxID=29376 RepID=A0A6N7IVB4_9FIRM|nr:cell division ATP-binding protein FtsE [Desulfofundulus thermobenzoicus]MQL53493.1 cell division ATP-binding protein FtsE [Desulfofundulus thermobenzoicus]HHW42721.1 cell division ATP-binding protein FtsE [Desulfotomaculum sp.]